MFTAIQTISLLGERIECDCHILDMSDSTRTMQDSVTDGVKGEREELGDLVEITSVVAVEARGV